MVVTLKLFAMLRDYLPQGASPRSHLDNEVRVEVPAGTTVQEVLGRFPMPPQLVQLVLVNGVFIPPEERRSHALHEGDALAIWPPVAGG